MANKVPRKAGALTKNGLRLGRPSKKSRPQPSAKEEQFKRVEVNRFRPKQVIDPVSGKWVRPEGPERPVFHLVPLKKGRPQIGPTTLDFVHAIKGKNNAGYAAAVAQAEADAKAEGNSTRAVRRAYLTVDGTKRKIRRTKAVIKADQQKKSG
jgi:hypothetical protein